MVLSTATVIVAGILLGHAPAWIHRQCQQTANRFGFAVPCPMLLPPRMEPPAGRHGCRLRFMAPLDRPPCGGAEWRGWAGGSLQRGLLPNANFQQFAVEIAPTTSRSYRRVIDWPLREPGARLVPAGSLTVAGRPVAAYYVPADNWYSIFTNDVVCAWRQDGHTFIYGARVVSTRARARALDRAVMASVQMVTPS